MPFLNREDVYEKIGGLRRNVEKKSGTSFNELLGELQAGAFMDSPSVGSIYRNEEAMQAQILQLRQRAIPTSLTDSKQMQLQTDLRRAFRSSSVLGLDVKSTSSLKSLQIRDSRRSTSSSVR